jgi:hypothetical protein
MNKQYLVHLPLDIADSTRVATEFGDPQVSPALAGKHGVGRGDSRITGHLFYPYFVDVMKDGLRAAFAASELGASLSALMHHSKKSNIATFDSDALNRLVVRCIDKVERNEFKGVNLTAGGTSSLSAAGLASPELLVGAGLPSTAVATEIRA